ncbi:MAG: hypothetical protein JWO71_1613 [Candidatus Acidoferrum typicum]|nr:hypothetical protein [Candidatus Acidoferrum typicum]
MASGNKFFIAIMLLALILPSLARSQESVADAARSAREQRSKSTKHPKIITNADLGPSHPVPSASAFHLQSPSTNADESPNPQSADVCDNPQAERLSMELQAAQQDLDQIRRDLQYNPPVVSENDLDLQYFQPGNSGLDVGAPPLLDAEPPAPERVAEVEVEEQIVYLRKALRVACEPPEAAGIQIAIYQAEDELNLLQRQFALDEDDYYSVPVTERLGGNPQLDAEQQQIEELQSEIDRLKAALAVQLSP